MGAHNWWIIKSSESTTLVDIVVGSLLFDPNLFGMAFGGVQNIMNEVGLKSARQFEFERYLGKISNAMWTFDIH
jgi:hypothetical protein